MNIKVSAFLTHKFKETMDDCFDRYALSTSADRFIVADGVSNSFFPGIWTELLCQAFLDYQDEDFDPDDLKCKEFINSYRHKWHAAVEKIANSPAAKYFTKRLFFQGETAACTYVGGQFKWENRYMIQTYALGDCCLFVFTNDGQPRELLYATLDQSYVFNNFPNYVDSRLNHSYGKATRSSFELPDSGLILMASDALSKWIFENYGHGEFERFVGLSSEEEFLKWVDENRQSEDHLLENDDVVLFRIAFSGSAEHGLTVERQELFEIPSPPSPDDTVSETDSPVEVPDIAPRQALDDVAESGQVAAVAAEVVSQPIPMEEIMHPVTEQEVISPPVDKGEVSPESDIEDAPLPTSAGSEDEENVSKVLKEITADGTNDTLTLIRKAVEHPLEDGEKVNVIKALLYAKEQIQENQ